ncbi:MAG: hypothetical protein ACI9H8_001566 [Lysobacterales bacterium]|jgi:hypothetical protein
MNLEYVALGMLILVVLVLFYGIIAIHDIPYEIAKKRNHPHQDVLHVAGWVSLFTLHAIWPFLWIWAMLYRDDRGWGMSSDSGTSSLEQRLGAIEERLSRSNPEQGE